MNSVRVLWLYLFLAILAGPLVAAEYVGKVVAISDGSGACNQLQMK
jgi:heme A synthase